MGSECRAWGGCSCLSPRAPHCTTPGPAEKEASFSVGKLPHFAVSFARHAYMRAG